MENKKQVYFVTSNKGKFSWAKKMLKEQGIEAVQKDIDMDETRDLEVEKVAFHKGKKISSEINGPFIVEDSGFYIKSLNNFPSTHIKFATSTIGIAGILKLLEDKSDRSVIFRSALVFFDKDGSHKIFICDDEGKLSKEMLGENNRGFSDLMKVFIPKGFDKTVAQMSDEEFQNYENKIQEVDHYIQFAKWFNKQTGENKK